MKTEDVISMALASGMYQDGEMFFSPSTGEADVHISDLEYFAKLVEERTLSKQKARYYEEGYKAGQHDMFTKSKNIDTSAERAHESDKSIHEKTHTEHPMRHWDRTCPACVAEQEHESRITALEIRVAKLEKPMTDHEKQLMAGQRGLLRTAPPSKSEPELKPVAKRRMPLRSKNNG